MGFPQLLLLHLQLSDGNSGTDHICNLCAGGSFAVGQRMAADPVFATMATASAKAASLTMSTSRAPAVVATTATVLAWLLFKVLFKCCGDGCPRCTSQY
jgi:hypothetical protein